MPISVRIQTVWLPRVTVSSYRFRYIVTAGIAVEWLLVYNENRTVESISELDRS